MTEEGWYDENGYTPWDDMCGAPEDAGDLQDLAETLKAAIRAEQETG